MKNTLFIAVFLLGIILTGCDNKEQEETRLEQARQDSIRVADSLAQVEQDRETERLRAERKKTLEAGDTFTAEAAEADLQNRIKEGKVFLLSDEGETMPFKFEGGNIMAVAMPDGKMYQVEKDGDKIMLSVPGQGQMERRVVNGKVYLIDDDGQMFEVKVVNKKLVAMLDDGTEVNLARK